jgi:hypothetical protein
MGCQSAVNIGDYLTFSICTHDPDTGELTDADAAPTWRLYEDETAVPILTGTMSTLDAVNTTGFYTERVLCSAANGFEDGKSYTVYIEATVDGDTGGICYGFRAVLPGSSSSAPGTGLEDQVWTVLRGDTLGRTFSDIAADGSITKCQLTVKLHPGPQADDDAILAVDSTTGLIRLNGAAPGAYTATFTLPGGVLTVPAATMAQLEAPKRWHYDVQVWRGAAVETIEMGRFVVVADVTRLAT